MKNATTCDECGADHGGHECWCSLHTADTDLETILRERNREVGWWICVNGRRVQRFQMPAGSTASPAWVERQVLAATARGEDWAGDVTTERD